MGSTPPEEIDKQHQAAQNLVDSNTPCADVTYRDEISLVWKQTPTEELKNSTTSDCPCFSSRGHANVSKLVSLVKEGYNDKLDLSNASSGRDIQSLTNLWDEANAAANNVNMTRPSHDAWGIKKIVLVFSDDFLQDTYEMPWWHARPDIREAVEPVLNVLNIPACRVVRLLLAALPPGVTIPTHHDSGEWVKYTHRVHCPVIVTDPMKVLVTCGLSTEEMLRVDCSPGHVFELNNQGKHAVSNCGEDHRVHLILDYVDDDFESVQQHTFLNRPRRRILLEPGEQLLQTRRSVDRAIDKGKRPTPSFMILGAQKAGTTSIYEYMMQHPLIARPKRRETHCLDWRWNNNADTLQQQRQHCLSFYYAKELQHHPSCLTGDSTPSYLLDSVRVIPRLKHVIDHDMKFIVMLRDPVQRAYSHYQMVTCLDGTPEQIQTRGLEWRNLSFHQVVMLDFQKMKECGLIPYWNITEGSVDQELFDSFVGSHDEIEAWNIYLRGVPLKTGSHSLISRGMYDVQLRPWFDAFSRDDFLVFKLDDLKTKEGIQATMNDIWKLLQIPSIEVKDDSAKNTRNYDKMDQEIREYLKRFYEPHNHRLSVLLGSEWNDIWCK